MVVVETPHVSVSWAGLEEVKQLAASLGEVASSSCIPAVSTVGGWRLYYTDIYCYLLLDGEGCLKAVIFKQTIMTLSTRDSAGAVCPGPGLADISCSIEPVGGLDSSTLPRLIQVAATGAPSHLTPPCRCRSSAWRAPTRAGSTTWCTRCPGRGGTGSGCGCTAGTSA